MKAYIIPLLLLFNTSTFAQSNTTTQLKETYPESSFTYFYGSVIRAAVNLSDSKSLIDLIKNIDLIVYSAIELNVEPLAKEAFNRVFTELQKEQFTQFLKITEGQALQKLQSMFDDLAALTLKENNKYK